MNKSLKQIQKDVDSFCEERSWNHEHPNNLITATVIELGELAEHYQWDNEFKKYSETEKKEIGYEFVDVLFYLCRLANKTGVNIEEAFYDKLPKLAKKFPVGKNTLEANKEYREKGKNKLYD